MKSKDTEYQSKLQAKAQEILASLRNRGRIAVEYSAEDTEQTVLRDERDLAVLNLDRDTRLLREVRSALERLSAGTFGICEECEGTIQERRLAALPWARRCVSCQEKIDQSGVALFRNFSLAA
jgi:DnaK suppressor protein